MFKYVQRKSQISENKNARNGDNDDDVNINFEVDTNVDNVVVSDVALDDDHSNEVDIDDDVNIDDHVEDVNDNVEDFDIFDPRNWDKLSSDMIKLKLLKSYLRFRM
nr:hypothetical protein [Tanacetum cinerariifolium]